MSDYIHSQAMQFNTAHVSCGILEVHHLPDHSPSKLCFSVATALYNKANPRPSAFVLFSDVVDIEQSRGKRLAEFVKKNPKFGELLETKKEVNPKSGNIIQVWLWHVNHDEFRLYYTDELANRTE